MTENRCIEVLKKMKHMFTETCAKIDENTALDMAVEAIKEIQAHRAMEARLNGISIEQVVNGFINQVEKGTHEKYEKGRILTNAEADDWNAYRAIGTVDEFKALKEKSVAKKAGFDDEEGMYFCPNCEKFIGEHQNYCWNCGQAFEC